MGEGSITIEEAKKWLEDLSHGRIDRKIVNLSHQGLKVVLVQRGLIKCNLILPREVADKNGNWHVGAIATLIDNIGIAAAAIADSVGSIHVSTDFNISYLSTAKIDEEVEVEAKVLGYKGNLTSVMLEVRRKETGEMIALGKQWISSSSFKKRKPLSKF